LDRGKGELGGEKGRFVVQRGKCPSGHAIKNPFNKVPEKTPITGSGAHQILCPGRQLSGRKRIRSEKGGSGEQLFDAALSLGDTR